MAKEEEEEGEEAKRTARGEEERAPEEGAPEERAPTEREGRGRPDWRKERGPAAFTVRVMVVEGRVLSGTFVSLWDRTDWATAASRASRAEMAVEARCRLRWLKGLREEEEGLRACEEEWGVEVR